MPKQPTSGDCPPTWLDWTCPLDQERDRSSTDDAASGCPPYVASRGPLAAIRLLGRLVPRYCAGCREDRRLPGRRRLPRLPRPPRASRPQARLARPRVLPDDQPLPPRRRGGRRPALRGVPEAQRPLRAGIQRTPRPVGSPVRRALLERTDRGRGRADQCLSLRHREPRPRRALRATRRLAVERLALRAPT
jgi:hypothetical protein